MYRIFSGLADEASSHSARMGFAGRTVPLRVMSLCPPTRIRRMQPCRVRKSSKSTPPQEARRVVFSARAAALMRFWASIRQGSSGCIRRSTRSSTVFTPRFSSWLSTARRVVLPPRKRTTAFSLWVIMTAGEARVPTSSMFTTFQFRAVSSPIASAASKMTVGRAARSRMCRRIAIAQSRISTRHTSAA